MAKSKLNTDLDKSAKKIKKTKSKDEVVDDSLPVVDEQVVTSEDEFPTEVSPEEDDDATYTMGEIQVAENGDNEEVDLKKAPPSDSSDDDEDDEWVDEEVNMQDVDPYLDEADYDMDNPYREDDSY